MSPERFSLKSRLGSFKYAFRGLVRLIEEQHNARIHLSAAVLVVILGFILKVSLAEWMLLTFAMGIVFVAELFNSAVESLGDAITSDNNDKIMKAKDYGAAGVLISAFIAVIIGALIFVPRVLNLF